MLFMGLMGCNILFVMHLQQYLNVLPIITEVKSKDAPEELTGAARFRMAANDVMKKWLKNKPPPPQPPQQSQPAV